MVKGLSLPPGKPREAGTPEWDSRRFSKDAILIGAAAMFFGTFLGMQHFAGLALIMTGARVEKSHWTRKWALIDAYSPKLLGGPF